MNEMELIGRCGLYCGTCSIYRAERDSQQWREKIAAEHNTTSERVTCQGCGALTSKCWGYDCKILQCIHDREIEFCDECPNYEKRTCSMFTELEDRYTRYGVNLRDNLEMIRAGKVDDLIRFTEKVFTCKSCGKLRATSTNCFGCGAEG